MAGLMWFYINLSYDFLLNKIVLVGDALAKTTVTTTMRIWCHGFECQLYHTSLRM